ncbi:futalosine hydrolase [Alkalihalobacillus sp. 1P02AB]|uniref:futalosine hydrolase n=1 Tax=Alkalihalobacillus sp. 1P02AB TaxID=3132260 RepID=UPI0039A505D0
MRHKRILLMVSVEAEREAIKKAIGEPTFIDVEVMGVGPTLAAATTTKILMQHTYDLVLNLGIAGGFKGRAPVGSIVVSTQMVAADLGSESPDGFLPVEQLNLGVSIIEAEQTVSRKLLEALTKKGVSSFNGQILTLSTVTGTNKTTEQLMERFPEAKAEAMEGFGVATAARLFEIPVIEVRTISNEVGPRNREAWKLKEALSLLEVVSETLLEVVQ